MQPQSFHLLQETPAKWNLLNLIIIFFISDLLMDPDSTNFLLWVAGVRWEHPLWWGQCYSHWYRFGSILPWSGLQSLWLWSWSSRSSWARPERRKDIESSACLNLSLEHTFLSLFALSMCWSNAFSLCPVSRACSWPNGVRCRSLSSSFSVSYCPCRTKTICLVVLALAFSTSSCLFLRASSVRFEPSGLTSLLGYLLQKN